MTTASIGSRLEAELESIAERCGCELLAARFASNTLRLVLDRPTAEGETGVTIDDCAAVSREASALLDVEDFAGGRYVLEVSSPGLDREFYRDADYERFAGRKVKVTWREPASGARRTDVGTLADVELAAGRFGLTTGGDPLTIRLSDVITTRLEPEF